MSACSDKRKEWVNPFLPYDEQLWVQHLSDTHTLLLNKFNVMAHHLICVTTDFQPQTDPLNAADLGATWEAMQVIAFQISPSTFVWTASISCRQMSTLLSVSG